MGNVLKFRGAPRGPGEPGESWMFDGLDGLAVVIEDLDPVAVAGGLNRTNLQLHVERRLGEAGITVAPFLGAAVGEAVAVLYVVLGAERHLTGTVACFLSLQVCEAAALSRDSALRGGVTTWLTNASWASSLGELERDAMQAIDEGLGNLGKSFPVGRNA